MHEASYTQRLCNKHKQSKRTLRPNYCHSYSSQEGRSNKWRRGLLVARIFMGHVQDTVQSSKLDLEDNNLYLSPQVSSMLVTVGLGGNWVRLINIQKKSPKEICTDASEITQEIVIWNQLDRSFQNKIVKYLARVFPKEAFIATSVTGFPVSFTTSTYDKKRCESRFLFSVHVCWRTMRKVFFFSSLQGKKNK